MNPENWGVSENTYGTAPKYYYDLVYPCLDCSKPVMWSAEEQKYWYEELGKIQIQKQFVVKFVVVILKQLKKSKKDTWRS